MSRNTSISQTSSQIHTKGNAEGSLVDPRTDALLQITAAIETAATLDELLLLALNEFAHLLDVPLCGVSLISSDGQSSRIVSTYPPQVSLPPATSLEEMPNLRRVLKTRQSIQIADLGREEIPAALRPLIESEHIRSALMVPLIAHDQAIGVLILCSIDEIRIFTAGDVALTRLMAGQLAVAITSFRITDEANRRSAELETLNDIAAAVTSSLDTHEIYHLVVQKLNEYFRVDAGSLLMRDDTTGDMEFVMTLEAGKEKLAGVRVPHGQGIVGYVAETQRYEIVHDPQNDPRFYRKISEYVGYETRAILCVPIVVKGRTIGVIELLNKIDGLFTEEDGQRLMRMAATIGVALENARLFQQVTTGRDRFEAILNSTNDGILMADMRGVAVLANPMAAQLLSISREDLLGRRLDDLRDELYKRAFEITTLPWMGDDKQATDVVELGIGGHSRRFIRHFTLPVHDADGSEIGRLAMFQDTSKERELAQLRDDYTGMLIHDLRAPLTAIMNGIMMVKRGLGGPVTDQQSELLRIAHQGSRTMLEMVNTLLDISKMEQGRLHLDLEPLSPYAIVDEVFDRLRVSAQNQEVHLRQQVGVGLPLVEADRDKLIRVLQNLLDNAIKFSPSDVEIVLGTAHISMTDGSSAYSGSFSVTLPPLADGEWFLFWVRDYGPGIPKQYHERIFEKFGQVRRRKVRGTGLGLTFCKLVVEAHQGRIWLESEEGAGSTFAFILPLTHDEARSIAS